MNDESRVTFFVHRIQTDSGVFVKTLVVSERKVLQNWKKVVNVKKRKKSLCFLFFKHSITSAPSLIFARKLYFLQEFIVVKM